MPEGVRELWHPHIPYSTLTKQRQIGFERGPKKAQHTTADGQLRLSVWMMRLGIWGHGDRVPTELLPCFPPFFIACLRIEIRSTRMLDL